MPAVRDKVGIMKTLFAVGDIVTAGPCMKQGFPSSIPSGQVRFVESIVIYPGWPCSVCGVEHEYGVRISGAKYPDATIGLNPCTLALYNPPAPELIQRHTERPKMEPAT
jgi:hypothetical protein